MSDPHVAWWVQRAIKDEQSYLIAVTAGLGSGKTHGAAQWQIDRMALNAKVKFFAYMMPIYEMIHNTALPKIEKVLEEHGWRQRDYEIVKSPFPLLRFKKTRQEIHFLSGNRPDKIRAVEYGDAVADEPGVTPADSLKRLRDRVRDPAAKIARLSFWKCRFFDGSIMQPPSR